MRCSYSTFNAKIKENKSTCNIELLYLCYLCLFAYSGVQHILSCAFFFFRVVYPMLSVSPDSPFLIVPLVFSNVYLYEYKHIIK